MEEIKKMRPREYIKIRGANENNLKNLCVDIPRNELVASKMTFFAKFCIPFIIGAAILFIVIACKYISWLKNLPRQDLKLIAVNIFSFKSIKAVWEVICESLLHRRIFRVNRMRGNLGVALEWRPQCAVSHEVRRRGQ